MFLRELQIIKTLDHPNIIKFYEVYHDKMYFYIVMEYCDGGELYERIVQMHVLKEK
jgi:calcium-dependent protein kinase